MDCNEARLLVDERVQGVLSPEQEARLAEHLRGCADCRQDLAQLTRTRELLSEARRDLPPGGELARIFQHIQANAAASQPTKDSPMPTAAAVPIAAAAPNSQRTRWKTVALSSLCAAAMLLVCYNLGRLTMEPRRESALASANAYWVHTEDKLSGQEGPAANAPTKEKGSDEWHETLDKGGGKLGWKGPAPETPMVSEPTPGPSQTMTSGGGSSSGGMGSSSGAGGDELNLVDAPGERKVATRNDPVKGEPRGDEGKPDGRVGEGQDAPLDRPKIIKTGDVTVEVKSYADASTQADALVVKYQGFVADSRTYDQPGGTKSGLIVIRVAPEKFELLFADLKKLGNVLNERAGGQDITAQYVDTEARIKNLQVAEERLQELIKSKTFLDKVESLLQVERELARVRGEIESYQGQMRVWQNQISLSTIRLSLQEPQRAVPTGSLSVEIASLTDAKKALDGALSAAGGQLLSGQIGKRPDGTLTGTYRLRVNFGRFGELIAAIKGLGRTEDETIANQPFGGAIPAGAESVPCDLTLMLFEKSVRLPSGNLNLEVRTMPDALANLKAALAAADASIVNNQSQRDDNGATTANIMLRVKAGRFQGLMDTLPSLGRVTNRVVNGESGQVQGGAAEVPCNIQLYLFETVKEVPSGSMDLEVSAFTSGRDQLSALIKEKGLQVVASTSNQRPDGTWTGSFTLGIKADAMDSVVSEFEKLGRVKSRELTGLGLGDLSKVDPNVIGQVTITLEEPPRIAPQEEGSFRLMLRDTFGGFLESMGIIIRGVGLALPWLVLLGLFAWFVVRLQRKKDAAKAASAPASDAKPEKADKSEKPEKKE